MKAINNKKQKNTIKDIDGVPPFSSRGLKSKSFLPGFWIDVFVKADHSFKIVFFLIYI